MAVEHEGNVDCLVHVDCGDEDDPSDVAGTANTAGGSTGAGTADTAGDKTAAADIHKKDGAVSEPKEHFGTAVH